MRMTKLSVLAAAKVLAVGALIAFGAVSQSHAANPCAANPCAANPCAANPCAANPCAANPCAANPCAANPCGANPCAANPCAPMPAAELSDEEAAATYEKLVKSLSAGYAKSGDPSAKSYYSSNWFKGWSRFNKVPYVSDTHGARLVNNYANGTAKKAYGKYEEAGVMPVGSILAKDSFRVTPKGETQPGPLFLMEKMEAGFSAETGDWRYTLITPTGMIYGITKGKGDANVAFCVECHSAVGEEQDHLFFLPEEYRK
ncbi:MAG: cytochrome P460 family protein [Sphingomonadales bacterium]